MKTRGIPLSSLPPKLQAQVVAQLATKSLQNTPEAKRLRQSAKGPNKTEAAFAAYLRAANCSQGDRPMFEQAVTLKLGNGVRYTPDIFCPLPEPVFYEVKGFMRDDAAVKIKVAAGLHTWARFYLATRKGKTATGWDIQHILP